MSKTAAEILLIFAEQEKQRQRKEAIGSAVSALEKRAATATGDELERLNEAIEKGKRLLESP